MKIRLAILESDEGYLNRIVAVFNTKYSDKFEIYSFTDVENALQTLSTAKIDVFVVNESIEIDTTRIPKRCGFAYFVDSADVELLNNQPTICRFQRAELIYKQILSIYAENAGNYKELKITDEGCKVIAFASPSGGVGCTTMAAACALHYAAQGRKALFLSLEVFGSSDDFFSGEGQFDMSDVIYALKTRRANLAMKLESCVKQDPRGVYFFSKAKLALDMLELTQQEILRLISELRISTNGIVADNKHCEITLTPSATTHQSDDGVNLYGMDEEVSVAVKVKEAEPYSGIKSITYRILNGDTLTDSGTLYSFDIANPIYDQLKQEFTAEIPVSKEDNNSCRVTVEVTAVDNAGNVNVGSVVLDIDNTAPVIDVAYHDAKNPMAVDNYYTARSAEITVTERTHHFDSSKVVIRVTGVDAKGKAVSGSLYELGAWSTKKGTAPDEATHTATIRFPADANYTFTVDYTDLAGNKAEQFKDSFTVDATEPTGTVAVRELREETWSDIIKTLTFGLWSSKEIKVEGTAQDATSPLKSVMYYKTDKTTALKKGDLDKLSEEEWKPFFLDDGLTVSPNEKTTVYLRLVDNAGNVCYISTDGLVADDVPCEITLKPSETLHKSNDGVNLYGMDEEVSVAVKVKEAEPYSGIKSITYRILNGDTLTDSGTLYSFDIANPIYDQLKQEFTAEIPVSKEDNNSCRVTVEVTAVDNAGNVNVGSVVLDIDNTAPVIDVAYHDAKNPMAVDNYYTARSAEITVTERTHHFDSSKVVIRVTGVDAKGKAVSGSLYELGAWSTKKGTAPDEATHTATIRFPADANYTFTVDYTDLAGNKAEQFKDSFTVDQTKPTGTIFIEKLHDSPWSDLITAIRFVLFSGNSVMVRQTNDDATSSVAMVSYYRTSGDNVCHETDLDELPEEAWTTWRGEGLQIDPDARVVVYLRIVDMAGNIRYVSTDGFIVDRTMPVWEDVAPIITVTPPQPVNDIYNADVSVAVHVQDPIVNTSYSGLREITYQVKNMGTVTQEGTLYRYDGAALAQKDLMQYWQQSKAITVDAAKNNSNNVEIYVHAVDNSGNESEQSVFIQIDVTAPTISVSYDNNNGDTAFADVATDAYFDAPRTATIVVTERNFDPNAVVITATNTDGQLPVLSGWRTEPAGGNGDGTRNVATLSYQADGDYTFEIRGKDLAGNETANAEYNGLAPQKFTIDKTAPVISVTYEPDDSAAQNGNYFNVPRTATITVNEHNFETSRVSVSLTATDDGDPAEAPVLGEWTNNGDVHTATISYTADSMYVFDIDYRDKAGNAAADYAGDTFFVDQTMPALELKGVVDESANAEEKIGFVLTATDTNFDVFTPVVTGTFYRDGKFVTEPVELTADMIKDVKNGKKLEVKNLPEDGYYTVACTVVDKAGNAFDEITLYDKAGNAYLEKKTAEDALVTFTVNRDGSVYYIDSATTDIVNRYYIQNVTDDVVLVEINPNELSTHVLTLNKRELQEGVDYTVRANVEENWNKYTYTVNRAIFEAEGAYTLVAQSKDQAGNDTFSDIKGVGVKFVVDRTAPVVTASGLEINGRYQTDSQVVTLIPTDDGGALYSLEVLLVDNNGNTIRTLVEKLEGQALEKALEEGDGKISFTLDEGLFQNVRIICDDCAYYGDEANVIYDQIFTDVSVSSSPIKIFWANKPLRWGTIGGAVAIVAAVILAILMKKRKKEEKKAGKH